MTRTGPTINPISWDTKPIVPDDGSRIDSVACQDARPKGRIRRSMTACNTCRKLKTRCDVDPRGHSCRRCLSLRLDCELPETTERFQDNASTWSDATAIPSIEERLVSLERGMGEMIHLMRQMVNRSPSMPCSPTLQTRNHSIDGISSSDSMSSSFYPLKPAQLIRDLQAECFGERDQLSDADILGDIVTQGIVDSKLSMKLIELFVEYFGHWVSINHPSSIQRSNTLLFNTACLLASRYLPGLPQHTVRDISLCVQHAVAKVLWKPPPMTSDMLQALTLLCLYSTSIHKEGLMDDWLLSGISINHALISFNFLNTLPGDRLNPDELLAQLRLWNTLCATQLHSALANGRTVNIQQQYIDQCPRILEYAAATPEDGRIVAEIQLYRIALRLQHNQHRLRFAEPEYEELERWKLEWAHLLTTSEDSTLNLSLWFCQLLLHRTVARLQPDSERLVPEICGTARLIITQFLQTRFTSAPALIDHVYFIVGYAALTLCDYTLTDPLISQVRGFLLHLAPGGDNLSYRIACIVGEVQRRYSEASVVTAGSHSSSPVAEVKSMQMFGPSSHHRTGMDISQLMSSSEGLDSLVEGYNCLEQMMPGYAAPQPAFEAPDLFHHSPPTGVTGGAMPIGLVPRALHDW
ncbi:transcriptional regulator family: Fungal Specific TF [Penicillium roqueforti]|nr:transcriptional regulator family: Fungal Specific TF [Penicillium roqueforti]KAI2685731.1 transcriptional regulator family: Fungal Specific TF [Penicillium roqueforti]KAI2691921.1 transcriptional regulator family: Fungal Specific TF [Penicillium roqueforti]KAI2698633.1 transcriptional regulator family: Fungal Specific TF [Penicillium roqueforti]KAI2704918.1 transcriptional regulator family: Fungal Specific TF [Penicillium roqueforti]